MSKRILPKALACTISPTGSPDPRLTCTRDFTSFAGRLSTSTTPVASRTSRVWVRNWSIDDTNRRAFFAADWPTSTTAPICWPLPSATLYSLVSSMSLVFCCTTRTGCSSRIDRPCWCWTWDWYCGCWYCGCWYLRLVLGLLGCGRCWRCSVQFCPSHQRVAGLPAGSGYQPGGGGGEVMTGNLVRQTGWRERPDRRRGPPSWTPSTTTGCWPGCAAGGGASVAGRRPSPRPSTWWPLARRARSRHRRVGDRPGRGRHRPRPPGQEVVRDEAWAWWARDAR